MKVTMHRGFEFSPAESTNWQILATRLAGKSIMGVADSNRATKTTSACDRIPALCPPRSEEGSSVFEMPIFANRSLWLPASEARPLSLASEPD